MKKNEIKACIVRVGGTNCDAETKRSLIDMGVTVEIQHINRLNRSRNLGDYDILIFPGGFSYGDYVRAGVILAKSFLSGLGKELKDFLEEEKPILGICNGFQVFAESGLLPGIDGMSDYPQAALGTNLPTGFRCRWVQLKHENKGNCIFTRRIQKGQVVRIPIAHGEGRFLFARDKEKGYLDKLIENDQIVFRYCQESGKCAEGQYPDNPNGSFFDIAGICDPTGTIFGLMPHPERAYFGWQLPDWTTFERMPPYGDGKLIFESLIEYVAKNF